MKDFLNRYMAANRAFQKQSEEQLRAVFETAVSLIRKAIGVQAFRPKHAVNAAVVDSVMTGIAARQSAGPIKDDGRLKNAYLALLEDSKYQETTTQSTADEESVRKRLQLAKEAFAPVP